MTYTRFRGFCRQTERCETIHHALRPHYTHTRLRWMSSPPCSAWGMVSQKLEQEAAESQTSSHPPPFHGDPGQPTSPPRRAPHILTRSSGTAQAVRGSGIADGTSRRKAADGRNMSSVALTSWWPCTANSADGRFFVPLPSLGWPLKPGVVWGIYWLRLSCPSPQRTVSLLSFTQALSSCPLLLLSVASFAHAHLHTNRLGHCLRLRFTT